jgi:uncharacterized RDD family membrane protein YckC
MTIYKFAGFWRRLGAYMVDCTIIFFIFIILVSIASLAFFSGAISGNSKNFIADLADPAHFSSIKFFIWIFFIFLYIAYFTYFHGTTGRTLGKMFFGLQVVSADGTPISFGIAFLRAVGYLVSNLLFIFPLGFIWAAFDKRKQGWHDKIAGTVVIIREQQNDTEGISIPDNLPKESMTQASEPPENNNN